MARTNRSQKPPSRKRYEEEHRTRSARFDKQTNERLNKLLEGTGCSFADFVKDALGREESMVEKRVSTITSRLAESTLEERVKCLENLVHEIFSITVDTHEFPPYCPRCDNQELYPCEGRETESKLAKPWVLSWKCPKCEFFINTYKRIDPVSFKWIDLESGKYVDKPKILAEKGE